MAKEMMKRFQDAYDYLYHNGSINSKTDLAKIMGAGRTSISYAYNGRPEYLNEKFLIKFSNAFPGVFNIDWLLTGDGEMLKKAQEDTKSNEVTNSSDENISRLLEQNKELIEVLKKSLEESQRTNSILLNELSELRKGLTGVTSPKTELVESI